LFTVTDVLILGLFATSYNVLLGYSGMLSFGHSAYFGLGAYASALALLHMPGMPPLLAIVFGALVAALGGLVVGAVCVRRSGPYFSMLTLAFGMLFYTVAWKWRSVTQGDDGFGAFMPAQWSFPLVGVIRAGDYAQGYRVVLVIVAALLALTWALMSYTPYGNAIRCIRQNEERASFLGYNVFIAKLANYMLASALAGVAGALSVLSHNFVSTDVIGLERSTEVVMMTYIGGTSWFFGPMLGSAFVVMFGDFLAGITARWQLIMGVIFVLMVMYAPQGFSGMVRFAIDRFPRRAGAAGRVRVGRAGQ
jgi:branched-chain amino acid transport system permease protein